MLLVGLILGGIVSTLVSIVISGGLDAYDTGAHLVLIVTILVSIIGMLVFGLSSFMGAVCIGACISSFCCKLVLECEIAKYD